MEPLEDEYINNPSYYKGKTGMEAIDVIEEFELNFSQGCIVKYVLRAGKKGVDTAVEDLKKARNYIDREIERVGAESKQKEMLEGRKAWFKEDFVNPLKHLVIPSDVTNMGYNPLF